MNCMNKGIKTMKKIIVLGILTGIICAIIYTMHIRRAELVEEQKVMTNDEVRSQKDLDKLMDEKIKEIKEANGR